MNRTLKRGKKMINGLTSRVALPLWGQELLDTLIEQAQASLGEVGCHEADNLRAAIVEALALAGDLEAAQTVDESISVAESISHDGFCQALARESIIRAWARVDPARALELASAIAETGYEKYKNEQSQQRLCALFAVLQTIDRTSRPEEVRKLADLVIGGSLQIYLACVVIRARATAAMGDIDGARKIAEEAAPYNQIPGHLAVYEYSRAVEDIQAARAIAERYGYSAYEQWLQIAGATHELQDIERARAEVAAIRNKDIERGFPAYFDFERNSGLLALARISGALKDIVAAREGILANPESSDLLFMALCRITQDPDDFALLLKSAMRKYRHGIYRVAALACIAEITGEERDFIATSAAVLAISAPPEGISLAYLQGRSWASLAQILVRR